jgi:hypothetical protein
MTLSEFLKHHNTVGLLKAVAESPGDPLPRHLLADHAEEYGFDNVAKGQRWAAKHGKYASKYRGATDGGGWIANEHHPQVSFDDVDPVNREPHLLPDFFDPNREHAFRWGAHPDKEVGTIRPERAFIEGSHALNWHPETGEPEERKAK